MRSSGARSRPCAARCASSPGPARARRRRSRAGSRTRSRPARSRRPRSSPSRSPTRRPARCGRGSRRSAPAACGRGRSTRRRSRSCATSRPGEVGRILLVEGARCCARSRTGCRAPYRFRPAGDLATEIEWAKNRRIPPDDYRAALGDHEPPIPADLMLTVYRALRGAQGRAGAIDFEDLLERTVRLYETDEAARAEFRARYRAFTVDEYQDVNLLQQTLLERWLGDRDDLCVVGDDYQSIYGFTGASPEHLLGARSGPAGAGRPARGELPLDAAGARAREPARAEARRRREAAARDAARTGRSRSCAGSTTRRPRARSSSSGSARCTARGLPLEEIAVLCRTNARWPTSRRCCTRRASRSRAPRCWRATPRGGLLRATPRRGRPGGRGGRASALASRLARGAAGRARRARADAPERPRAPRRARARARRGRPRGVRRPSSSALRRRAVRRRGVHLLTYHRAKGLECDAVFLPAVEEKRAAVQQARTERVAEERRLLYVGLTRARRHLTLSWSGKPSRFLGELGVERRASASKREAARAGLARSSRP